MVVVVLKVKWWKTINDFWSDCVEKQKKSMKTAEHETDVFQLVSTDSSSPTNKLKHGFWKTKEDMFISFSFCCGLK